MSRRMTEHPLITLTALTALVSCTFCYTSSLEARTPKKAKPKLQVCTSGVLDKLEKHRDWEHRRSALVASGKADHSAQDILTTMAALNYDPETRIEVAAILQSLKPEIIHV